MAAVAQWDQRDFGGSPYVTITAINTAGGIETPRTTGKTPMFIQASASAITATGTSEPYEHLEFTWTLEVEDGVGGWEAITDGEGLTNPVSDTAYNQYTDQEGPEFVAVIRDEHLVGAAQTDYRLTLNIRGQNGGSYTTASTTQTFTVDPWAGTTYYFDASGGNDTTGDGSMGNPWATLSGKWPTINADNVKCLLKRGTTESMTADLVNWNVTSVRFDAWDSGADPILRQNSGERLINQFWNSPTSDTQDIVLSNIEFDGNDQSAHVIRFQGTDASAIFQYWFFDNCTIKNNGLTNNDDLVVIEGTASDIVKGFGFYKTHFDYTNGQECCVYFGGGPSPDWTFAIATTNTGGGESSVLDHPFYINLGEHFLADVIQFGTIDTMNLCLNLRRTTDTSTDHGKWNVRNCDCNGANGYLNGVSVSNTFGTSGTGAADGVVISKNAFRNLTNGGGNALTQSVTLEGTFRDNQIFNSKALSDINSPDYRLEIYHNNCEIDADSGAYAIEIAQANSSLPWLIVDNKFLDTRTAAKLLSIADTADATSATINGNGYYAPNDSDGDVFDIIDSGTPAATFAEWQAEGFDADATYGTDFGWIAPANGDFRVATYNALSSDASLKARWNGDADGNGTGDADDLIGTADGTWTGTASYTDPPTGKGEGKSFVLDGSSDIDCGDVAPYPDGTDFSISFWVRDSGFTTTVEYLVSQSSGFETGWGVRTSNGSAGGGAKVTGFVGDMPGTGGMAHTGDRSVDTWHFVTLEYDFSAGTARASLDGTFTATADVDTETQFTNLSIGSRNGSFKFTGDIYDVRVWDRVLTASDISELIAGPEPTNTTACTIQVQGGGASTVGATLEINATSTWNDYSNGTGSTAYQWLLDGLPISGATSSTYVTAATGVYTLEETRSNDGGSDPNEVTVSSNSVTITAAASGSNRNLLLLGVG